MSGDRYFIRDKNAIYFLTFTVIEWLDVFSRLNHKTVVVDALNYCVTNKGLNVHAWCLMTSHLHLIASARENYTLSSIIRDFKEHTAKEVIRQILEEPESRRKDSLQKFKAPALKINASQTINFGNLPTTLLNWIFFVPISWTRNSTTYIIIP